MLVIFNSMESSSWNNTALLSTRKVRSEKTHVCVCACARIVCCRFSAFFLFLFFYQYTCIWCTHEIPCTLVFYVHVGFVKIVPNPDSQTFVNGRLITEPEELRTRSRVILGNNHVFRFTHPEQGMIACILQYHTHTHTHTQTPACIHTCTCTCIHTITQ